MDKVRATRMAAELRGTAVGGWAIEGYLGNGASAVVLAARRDEQTAALKLIDPEMVDRFGLDQQLARIRRECELIGHTEPHLVQIFDGGHCTDTSYLYLAMELLPHPPLSALVPQFPREQIGPVIRQIASAARFLENRRLAHRDIKPDNVVITRACEHAVLLDLGVVRPLTEDLDDAGTGASFLGTTRYSPPEYVMREEPDDDLAWRAITFYQLGAVLHDMIMRRTLFSEITGPPGRLIESVRFSRPVIDAPDVPPHLVSLARNCLQKEWRVRLDLVEWQHFSDGPPAVPGAAAKDRIRRRLQRAIGGPAQPRPQPVRPARGKILENVGGSIANMVREICLQAGTFPPLEVTQTISGDEGRHVHVRTGPSERHSLEHVLEICLALTLLDEEGLIIRMQGVSAVGALPEDVPLEAWTTIYAGETSAPALRERLDNFLHLALDTAQEVGAPNPDLLLRLPPIG